MVASGVSKSNKMVHYLNLFAAIHRKEKDGGGTFYHNTLRTKLNPLRT